MIRNTILKKNINLVPRLNIALLFVFLIFVLVSLLVPAPPIQAAGNTYYVSTSGSDNNSGTQSRPWQTLEKAVRTATAGDTVYVRGALTTSGF